MYTDEQVGLAFGDMLREKRKSANITQGDMAAKLGMARTMYTHIENGKRMVSFEVLLKLIDILDVDVNEFAEIIRRKYK